MGNNRGRQKKLEQKKKKRALAQKKALAAAPRDYSTGELHRLAPTLPFGPAFMSETWTSDDDTTPPLVTVAITRRMTHGSFIVGIALVDRTFFGVKDAHIRGPMSRDGIDHLFEHLGQEMLEVSVPEAQSVVFHAIAWAKRLGMDPHPDFPSALFGPPPDPLLDTPLARPRTPVYMPGPRDDNAKVMRALTRWNAERPEGAPSADEILAKATEVLTQNILDIRAAQSELDELEDDDDALDDDALDDDVIEAGS